MILAGFAPLIPAFLRILTDVADIGSAAHYAPLRWPSVLREKNILGESTQYPDREIKSGFHVIPTLRAGRRCGLIDTNILHLNLRGQVTVGPLALRFFKIQVRMLNHLE